MQSLTIRSAVLAAIDALGDGLELASIGQGVKVPGRPEPCR